MLGDPQGGSLKAAKRGASEIVTGPWADLVMAMLSVNNYPLERTFALFDALQAQGLFDPAVLNEAPSASIAKKLGAGGYNRGDTMTAIFTDRLVSLGAFLGSGSIGQYTEILEHGSCDEVRRMLAPVKGVGPRVLENFFLLRGDR